MRGPVRFARIIDPMKPRAAVAFVAVGILWGSAWIPNATLLHSMPTLRAGALRFAIAAAFTAPLALLVRRRAGTSSSPRAIFGTALILGLTALALPYALIGLAAGQVSQGAVPILFALMPLVALLLSGEVASAMIPALVIGVGGVALVANGVSLSAAQIKGTAMIICSVVSGAFSLNYAKAHLERRDLLISVALQFSFASVLLAALSVVIESGQPAIWNRDTVLSLLSLGVMTSSLTLPLVYWLLTMHEPWQVAALQWSATLVAVAESAWFLHAMPSTEMWVGAVLILGAIIWLLRACHRRPDAVTLQITNHTGGPSAASESEVRSK